MKVSTTSSSVLSIVMTGGDSAPCARMLVFLRLIVSPNSLQAWDSLSTRCWRPSSLWNVKAASSEKQQLPYGHHISFGFGADSRDVEEFAV